MAISQFSQGSEATQVNDDLFSEELPMVLSATRLRQSQLETPAAITIIDRELISASGARSIVEVLRLVPGMNVGYSRGNTPEVSIHGLHTDFSRHLQVLVDGRSVFKPGLSRVLWGSLPISVSDIERIEVVRGPNTTSYGANSFLGVINIITRHPSDVESQQLSVTVGNRGIADGSVRMTGQSDTLSYRLTAGHHQDDGFDIDTTGIKRFDNHDTNYLRADISYQFDNDDQLRFIFGASESNEDQDLLDIYQLAPSHNKRTQDSFGQIIWDHNFSTNHDLQVNAYYSFDKIRENWQTCPPAIFMSAELGSLYDLDANYTEALINALSSGQNPPTPPSTEAASLTQQVLVRFLQLGSQTNCGIANQNFDESKWELEIQDTYSFNESLRLVSGFSLRRDAISGESFFEQRTTNNSHRVFANLEWRVQPQWLVNLGAMYENDDYVGGELSPRFALNYLANNRSAWRVIISEGKRTPDFYEQVGHRQYRVRELAFPINGTDTFATFYQTPQSRGDLISETIKSREIGWFYRPSNNLDIDIKLYSEQLENVIDGLFGLDEFDPQNAIDYTQNGVDLQLNYHWNETNRFWFSYSYLDIDPERGRNLQHQAAQNTLSLLYAHQINDRTQFSTAYYWQDIRNKPDFKRVDARFSHSIPLQSSELHLELVIQYNINDQYFFDKKSAYDDKTTAYMRARLNF
ncbi:MAG: TonB-dependent receptor plug domain-containing protein [Kangiellaceae bacterium]|nr:TonB-dependent receptor plug domain-containing protein [Kangiellaceae bacterium]